MARSIGVVHRIIATVAILVQAVGGRGVEVGGVVGGDKAAPFGGVIPGVAVVQAGIVIVVVTAITNRVGFCDRRVAGNRAVAPSIIDILSDQSATGIVDTDHVAQRIPVEVVGCRHTINSMLHTDDRVAVTIILPLPAPAVKKKPPRS